MFEGEKPANKHFSEKAMELRYISFEPMLNSFIAKTAYKNAVYLSRTAVC